MIQLSVDPGSLSLLDKLLLDAEKETKRRIPELARYPQALEEAHQRLHRIRDCRAQIVKGIDAMRTANVRGAR